MANAPASAHRVAPHCAEPYLRRLAGNSAKATSGMNGAPTEYQERAGIADTLAAFQADTARFGLLPPRCHPLTNAGTHGNRLLLILVLIFALPQLRQRIVGSGARGDADGRQP